MLRFFSKVDKISSPNGCWLWIASTHGGYGQFYDGTTMAVAHRVSWELKNGPIPDGLCVLHNCPGGDNPLCVNPDHLWLGDRADNARDKVSKRRQSHTQIKGESNGQSKVTEEIVAEIRELYSTGLVTQQILANHFGISQVQVSNIVRELSWRLVYNA